MIYSIQKIKITILVNILFVILLTSCANNKGHYQCKFDDNKEYLKATKLQKLISTSDIIIPNQDKKYKIPDISSTN